MDVERRSDNTFWITERTPGAKDFKKKAEKLLNDVIEYAKDNNKIDDDCVEIN